MGLKSILIAISVAGDERGRAMEDDCAAGQTELARLVYEFPDEALENAAITGGGKAGNITLYYYYCTALFFCPSP